MVSREVASRVLFATTAHKAKLWKEVDLPYIERKFSDVPKPENVYVRRDRYHRRRVSHKLLVNQSRYHLHKNDMVVHHHSLTLSK